MGEPRWSEDSLHVWLAQQSFPRGLRGSRGHDAAVLGTIDGTPALCADQCIEGVHFVAGTEPALAGRKAVLRTLSDLAATACTPVSVTLNLRAPAATEEASMQGYITGAAEAAREHGAELVGGDIAMAPGPVGLSVCALGSFPEGVPPPARDRAEPGQVLGISGPVGGSFKSGRHLDPKPRFDAAYAALGAQSTAMMDVSDGLSWDLFRLARASDVRIILEVDRIPIHSDVDVALPHEERLDRALHDGEDHELVATWPATSETPNGWSQIGSIAAGSGLWLRDGRAVREWDPSVDGGWRHDGKGGHG